MNEEESLTWFIETLEILGHANPKSVVKQAFQDHDDDTDNDDDDDNDNNNNNNNNEANKAFQQIIMWLEDRVIRLWTLEERMKLRHSDYTTTTGSTTSMGGGGGGDGGDMTALEDYLEQLECPYKANNNSMTTRNNHIDDNNHVDNTDDTTSQPDTAINRTPQQQQQQKEYRIRIMYWILSCAISESFQEQVKDNINNNNHEMLTTVAPPTRVTTSLNTTTTTMSTCFPLGFTTEDPMVDDQLTLRRMQYLLRLRQEQNHINDCIVLLQQTTVKE